MVDLGEYYRLQQINQISEEDVVIVVDENKLPRERWKLGHVTELVNGSDGVFRGAKVDKLFDGNKHHEMERSIQKLV